VHLQQLYSSLSRWRLYGLAESITLSGGSLSVSITTTYSKLQAQAGHKARDTFEYAILHDSLPGSTFRVLPDHGHP
jgi:hypothetical protein